jgi:predicted RNA polymerase sigma factor
VAVSATHRAIDAVWRIESARLIAGLTRVVRDVSVAEDLAQDALVAALEQWPRDGIPDNPAGWLMATAKRRGIDALRRRVTLERKQELIGHELQILQQLDQPDLAAQVDDVQDDLLRLIFMTCDPCRGGSVVQATAAGIGDEPAPPCPALSVVIEPRDREDHRDVRCGGSAGGGL